MPEDVWAAITPMLLTTGGDLILISTPFGRSGYFYESYHNKDFKTFHVNSVQIMETRPISDTWTELHRENARSRLRSEQERMTKKQFAQEYLGQFVDDVAQFFPDDLIRKCMNAQRPNHIMHRADHYLGVDIARMGEDESTFEIIRKVNDDNWLHVELSLIHI